MIVNNATKLILQPAAVLNKFIYGSLGSDVITGVPSGSPLILYIGGEGYIDTGEEQGRYLASKQCIEEQTDKGLHFPELLKQACESGLQYINEVLSGYFKISDDGSRAEAIQNGRVVHTYSVEKVNDNTYLYDIEKIGGCEEPVKNIMYLFAKDHDRLDEVLEGRFTGYQGIYHHVLRLGNVSLGDQNAKLEAVNKYTFQAMLHSIDDMMNNAWHTPGYTNMGYFNYADCGIFKVGNYTTALSDVISSINTTTAQGWLSSIADEARQNITEVVHTTTAQDWLSKGVEGVINNITEVVNAEVLPVLIQEVQHDEDKEGYSVGTLLAAGVGVLAAIGACGYAIYQAYQYCKADNTSQAEVLHKNEYVYYSKYYLINECGSKETVIIGDSDEAQFASTN